MIFLRRRQALGICSMLVPVAALLGCTPQQEQAAVTITQQVAEDAQLLGTSLAGELPALQQIFGTTGTLPQQIATAVPAAAQAVSTVVAGIVEHLAQTPVQQVQNAWNLVTQALAPYASKLPPGVTAFEAAFNLLLPTVLLGVGLLTGKAAAPSPDALAAARAVLRASAARRQASSTGRERPAYREVALTPTLAPAR